MSREVSLPTEVAIGPLPSKSRPPVSLSASILFCTRVVLFLFSFIFLQNSRSATGLDSRTHRTRSQIWIRRELASAELRNAPERFGRTRLFLQNVTVSTTLHFMMLRVGSSLTQLREAQVRLPNHQYVIKERRLIGSCRRDSVSCATRTAKIEARAGRSQDSKISNLSQTQPMHPRHTIIRTRISCLYGNVSVREPFDQHICGGAARLPGNLALPCLTLHKQSMKTRQIQYAHSVTHLLCLHFSEE